MKLKDFIIIGSLFLVAVVAFIWITFFTQSSGNIANVYVGNKVVASIDFDKDTYELTPQNEDYPKVRVDDGTTLEFEIQGKYIYNGEPDILVIEVDFSKNQIRIKSDHTPQQIGVNRGWYGGQGLPVISLPNQVVILFEAESEEVDGAV